MTAVAGAAPAEALRRWNTRDRARRMAAYATTALGVMGLLSAASPPLRGRLHDILYIVPLVVPRTAAVTLVFVSTALILTARGLRRGLQLAWMATLALLGVSAVLHLMKGFDFEEAALSIVGAGWLATKATAFPVRPTRAALIRALFLAVGGTAVVLTVATGLAAWFRQPDLDAAVGEAWRRLGGVTSLPLAYGGRFATPALVAVGLGLLGGTLWLLLSPRVSHPLRGPAHRAERERARAVVARFGTGTLDYFALRDDKQWFFVGRSVVAHAVRGGVCLVSPDPIGPVEERADVWAEFMAFAETHGWTVTVLGADQDWLEIYEASGLRSIYLGDEAIVDCPTFSLEGRPMRGLRQACHRVERAGYTATFHDPAHLDADLRRALTELSTHSRRGEAERGFSMTLSRMFDPADTDLLLSVARDADGTPQAFIQWVPAPGIAGRSLDVMRRNTSSDLPNGVIDFLVVESIRYLADMGEKGLCLNFAVWRSVVAGEHEGWLGHLGQRALRRASNRTQLESLWRFNAKFHPRWVPRYVLVGSMDTAVAQSVVMADAEGLTELPVIGRFLNARRSAGGSLLAQSPGGVVDLE